jgi:hypothetical protein
MAKVVDLPTYTDKSGKLTVFEKIVPFNIEHIFYLVGNKKTLQTYYYTGVYAAIINLKGSYIINCRSKNKESSYKIVYQNKCLIVTPDEEIKISLTSYETILMILNFNKPGYVYEES